MSLWAREGGKERGALHEEETVCKDKGYEDKWCVFRESIINSMWLDHGSMAGYKTKNVGWYEFRKGFNSPHQQR